MIASSDTPKIDIISADGWSDYELMDSGDGAKLERYGSFTFLRPEHQAVWRPALDKCAWDNAHAEFITTGEESGGHWKFRHPLPEMWPIRYHGLTLAVRPANSRHLGVFPEQAVHWDWISEQIGQDSINMNVLNLFGYTGAATLAAARAGARVTHVDASKKILSQARENQKLSGLENAPIRWIVDDALKFVRREVRRGVKYQGLILDPPKFGRGPKGEVWEFFQMLPHLLTETRAILGGPPRFLVITAYAIRASALTLYYAVNEMMKDLGGCLSVGELVVKDTSANRQLSLAIYARWSVNATADQLDGRQV